jgi:hypothetical protein
MNPENQKGGLYFLHAERMVTILYPWYLWPLY